jgi:hypothetical protein
MFRPTKICHLGTPFPECATEYCGSTSVLLLFASSAALCAHEAVFEMQKKAEANTFNKFKRLLNIVFPAHYKKTNAAPRTKWLCGKINAKSRLVWNVTIEASRGRSVTGRKQRSAASKDAALNGARMWSHTTFLRKRGRRTVKPVRRDFEQRLYKPFQNDS